MRLLEISRGEAVVALTAEDAFAVARACAALADLSVGQSPAGTMLYESLTVALEAIACACAADAHTTGRGATLAATRAARDLTAAEYER